MTTCKIFSKNAETRDIALQNAKNHIQIIKEKIQNTINIFHYKPQDNTLFQFGKENTQSISFQFNTNTPLPSSSQDWINLWNKNSQQNKKKIKALHILHAFYKGKKTRQHITHIHNKQHEVNKIKNIKEQLNLILINRLNIYKNKINKLQNLLFQLKSHSYIIYQQNLHLKDHIKNLNYLISSLMIENTMYKRQIKHLTQKK